MVPAHGTLCVTSSMILDFGNGPIECSETSVSNDHRTARNVAEGRASYGGVGLERWYRLDQTGSCFRA